MSGDTEIEKKICDVLRRNGKSNALKIAKEIGLDKRIVNKHLYILQKSNQVSGTNETPPVWDLLEKTSEIRQTLKPEQKPQTTRDTSEEKRVEDLLKTGGLKAHQIARDLGQSRQTINKQLYSMMEKGQVQKCSVSKVWTLNEEWSVEERLFEMITELAEGGYGWVYKVKHKLDAKIYALKKVNLIRKADSEVKALAKLDHPNIVRYITSWPGPDIWTSNQQRNQVSNSSTYLFIQMEFCDGGTLTDWIKERNHKEKQRTTVEIYKIFYEIITGVEFIHANKLIHRDLKPDNILFGADGTVKIGDFGLVAAQTDQNGDPVERSNKGTTTYMSPEQENKNNYDEKTDVFPLGLIWFEMVWEISTGMERVKLWPDLRNQRFPEGFSDKYSAESTFIMKMLSHSPEDRPHAKDVKRDLQTFFSLEQDLLSQKTI